MDHSTPNLPSRDFEATSKFYSRLGFEVRWCDEAWMILSRGSLVLEFFPHPNLNPRESWFSCCLRLNDLDAFYQECLGIGLPETSVGRPRLHAPKLEQSGMRIGALIDPDGSLIRLVQN